MARYVPIRPSARAAVMIRHFVACGFVLGLNLLPREAGAQIHADVALEGGVEKRFLRARPPLGEDASAGPTFELSARIAVLPLLRAGAYVTHDISPVVGTDTREITSAGLSFRLLSPWPRGASRVWVAAGFGYATAYAPSYAEALPSGQDGANVSARVSGTSGGFFEVPLGVGSSVRLGRGWELVAEAGARIGFGFVGSMYTQGPMVTSSAHSPEAKPAAGDDLLGVFLIVGLAYEL
jgi:hypothetical protein